MSWSEIPMELFLEMSKLLDVVDVVRSEKVCSWWQSMPCRKYAHNSQIPWIMLPWLSSGEDGKIMSRYFYSLTEHKIYELYLPEIGSHVCIGSSHGYLFYINCEAELIATNPLVKGAYLSLPSTSTFPDIVDVIHDPSYGPIPIYTTTIDGALHTPSHLYMNNFYYKKAILSPVADTIAVIHGYHTRLLLARSGDLAFARIGDQSWTVLEVPKEPPYLIDHPRMFMRRNVHGRPGRKEGPYVDDIIFHKGYLHAIYENGTLAIFDLAHPADPPFMSVEGSSDGKRYLVESPCEGKLFLVCRYFEYINGSKFTSEFPWRREFPRTTNFKVFILDEATYAWNRIKNLGDVSLFLGFNYSMSFCTRQFPNIERNCIHFIDDRKVDDVSLSEKSASDMGIFHLDDKTKHQSDAGGPKSAGDMGIFHLDDKTIGPLYPDSNLNRLIWPPPIFFMPTLT